MLHSISPTSTRLGGLTFLYKAPLNTLSPCFLFTYLYKKGCYPSEDAMLRTTHINVNLASLCTVVFLPVLKIVVGNFDITDIHPTRCEIYFLAGSRGLNLAGSRVLENEHAEIQRLDYLLHPQKRVNIAIPKEPLR